MTTCIANRWWNTTTTAVEVHIRDFFAQGDLTDDFRAGVLKFQADIHNYGTPSAENFQVNLSLLDANSKPLRNVAVETLAVPPIQSGKEATVAAVLGLPVRPWTAETPHLYTLLVPAGCDWHDP